MRNKVDEHFVDALWLISSAMRSGFSLQQAIELAAIESKEPLASAFTKVGEDIKRGSSLNSALLAMAAASGSNNVKMFADAIVLLRESGANISASIDSIASAIQAREQLAARVRTLTSQGIMQAAVLGAMPFVLLLVMSLAAKNYARLFFESVLGLIFLFVALVLWSAGVFCVVRILKVRSV